MKLNDIFEILLIESKTDDIIKNKIKDMVSAGLDEDESDLISFVTNYGEKYVKSIKNPHKSLNKFFDEVMNYYHQESVSYKTAFQMVYPIFHDFFTYKENGLIKDDFQQMSYNDMKAKIYEVELSKKRKELEKKINVIFENDEWKIIRVESKEASCKYGSNTRWCISGSHDNRYHDYSDNNYIYFVFDKNEEEINKKSSTYKIAVLVNKTNGDLRVWDAEDTEIKQIKFLDRFMRPLFNAIKKDSNKFRNKKTYDELKGLFMNNTTIKNIGEYELNGDNLSFDDDTLTITGDYLESNIDGISHSGFIFKINVLEQIVSVDYYEGYYDIKKEKTNTIYPNKPFYYVDSLQDIIYDIINYYNQ
jgi:hypothetical protein